MYAAALLVLLAAPTNGWRAIYGGGGEWAVRLRYADGKLVTELNQKQLDASEIRDLKTGETIMVLRGGELVATSSRSTYRRVPLDWKPRSKEEILATQALRKAMRDQKKADDPDVLRSIRVHELEPDGREDVLGGKKCRIYVWHPPSGPQRFEGCYPMAVQPQVAGFVKASKALVERMKREGADYADLRAALGEWIAHGSLGLPLWIRIIDGKKGQRLELVDLAAEAVDPALLRPPKDFRQSH